MKLIPQLTVRNTIYVNRRLSIKRGYLYFGNRNCEVKFLTLKELDVDEMLISINVINKLYIPVFCDFDLLINGNRVILGPHIGILTSKTNAVLDDVVQNHKNYVYDYKSISGCIAVFSLEGINKSTGLVTGYIYNSYHDCFERGVIPFPCVLFKRTGSDKCWREYFDKITCGRVFNDRLIGKWQAYKLLAADKRMKLHLPESILYQRPGDVRKMLEIYPELYIKHIYGSQGKEIISVKKSGQWVLARMVNNDERLVMKSGLEINEFLKTHIRKEEYIAQQAIKLITDNGRKIDFRIITIKDENGRWQVMGMIARIGPGGSIVSNVSSGGSAAMAYNVIKNVLELSEGEVYHLLQNMKCLAIQIGECLDVSGYPCGNLGIDLALDENAEIWIIEVNNKDPNHTIAIDADNRKLFYDTKRGNMLYARYLCGFGKGKLKEAY